MRYALLSILAAAAVIMTGCQSSSTPPQSSTSASESSTPQSASNRMAMNEQAQAALQQMTAKNAKIQDVVNNSYAYAIFPEVGSAAVGVGGASGKGVVYQNGQVVGTAKLDQGSVGLQVGGQTYSELIVFKDQDAYNRFTNGNLNFGAQTSATIVKAGAGGVAPFENGVAIYILPKGGLEAGVSVEGQKLTFHPSQQQ